MLPDVFLRAGIRRGDVMFDLGAFLGTSAIMEACRAGETGRVFAFEPSPATFRLQSAHIVVEAR